MADNNDTGALKKLVAAYKGASTKYKKGKKAQAIAEDLTATYTRDLKEVIRSEQGLPTPLGLVPLLKLHTQNDPDRLYVNAAIRAIRYKQTHSGYDEATLNDGIFYWIHKVLPKIDRDIFTLENMIFIAVRT